MNIKLNELSVQTKIAEMPDFLKRRMDEFFLERWGKLWGGKHILRGRIPDRQSIQLLSNDYLSIAGHEEIVKAQVDCLLGDTQSVLMSGSFLRGDNHQRRFERRMADYTGYESSILAQSGYAANVGLIQVLASDGVPVYMDMNAHASMWEGVISAGAQVRPFRHNDLEHLRRQLKTYGQGIVCVDSVYSTMGALCELEGVVDVATEFGCLIIVDESHSLGTHGPFGSGMVREYGLNDRVHFVTASLAKAFSGRAGIILCSKTFEEYFWCTARTAIFSSCLLPYEIAGLDKTLDIIIRDGWRREAMRMNADFLRNGLTELGYNVSASQSQIISLEAGPENLTLKLREALEERDVFGSVFCAPATAKNRSMIRLSINAGLTLNQVGHVLDVCAEIRDEVGMWDWASPRRLHRDVGARQRAVG